MLKLTYVILSLKSVQLLKIIVSAELCPYKSVWKSCGFKSWISLAWVQEQIWPSFRISLKAKNDPVSGLEVLLGTMQRHLQYERKVLNARHRKTFSLEKSPLSTFKDSFKNPLQICNKWRPATPCTCLCSHNFKSISVPLPGVKLSKAQWI